MNWLKSLWLDVIIKIVVTKIPLLKTVFTAVDGRKSMIGACLIAVYYVWKAALPILIQYFPEFQVQLAEIDVLMQSYWRIVGEGLAFLGINDKARKTLQTQKIS
jgi:hypothetical protein